MQNKIFDKIFRVKWSFNRLIAGYLQMLQVSDNMLSSFGDFLSKKDVPIKYRHYYKKWLRYYLDYCFKYRFSFLDSESLPHYLKKLREKKQTGTQQKQTRIAVCLFYELSEQQPEIEHEFVKMTPYDQGVKAKEFNSRPVVHENRSFADEYNRKKAIKKEQTNKSWQHIYDGLNNEMMTRHYSPRTHCRPMTISVPSKNC